MSFKTRQSPQVPKGWLRLAMTYNVPLGLALPTFDLIPIIPVLSP